MKKPCTGCSKQIPEAALHCVFCGAKQDAPAVADESVPATLGEALQRAAETQASEGAPVVESTTSSRAAVTLFGLRVDDLKLGSSDESGAPRHPMPLDPTPVRGLPSADRMSPAGAPYAALVRLVMASGGLVLVALFCLPWRGVSSWQLLETLVGAEFVRQLFFLAGGAILLATAALPVPSGFRAGVGALVASLPLVLGAEGLLDGWRGLGAALAIVALPATHLMRTRQSGRLDGTARGLVLVAAGVVALLYLVPGSSVMPIVWVGQMLSSMTVSYTVVGLFMSIPLVLAALSLLGALGRDLTSAAVLLATLILLWAPAAALVFIGDGTQLYLALALLWTSGTAALCVAQLLTMAIAPKAQRS